jgi:chemotaxis regulatin CheY-phosphate phosphatase CheZ
VENRLAKLDESVRRMESDFEARLAAMASEVASMTRAELEGAADVLLEQLTTRNAQTLATQLEDACTRLNHTQRRIEASVAEVLQSGMVQTMQSFERQMQESAQRCVERWSQALASQLKSVASGLGQPLRIEVPSSQPPAGE